MHHAVKSASQYKNNNSQLIRKQSKAAQERVSRSSKNGKNAGWNMTANDPALAASWYECLQHRVSRRVAAMQINAEAVCEFQSIRLASNSFILVLRRALH